MPSIQLEVSEDIKRQFEDNPEYYGQLINNLLREAIFQKQTPRSEWVKTLTRLQTPVTHWDELEAQIIKGALGIR